MNDIFLATVQHTGTWFLMGLFETNPLLRHTQLIDVIFDTNQLGLHRPTVIHAHLSENDEVLEKLVQAGREDCIPARNFYRDWNIPLCEMLVRKCPTVIPMIDPLKSIIERHRRHPNFAPHTYLVENWLKILRGWVGAAHISDPFFQPIELEQTYPDRMDQVLQLVRHCGLEPWPAIGAYVREWGGKNTTTVGADVAAKYDNGDVAYMEKTFPAEIDLLRESDDLKGLFEQHGYKELMWW